MSTEKRVFNKLFKNTEKTKTNLSSIPDELRINASNLSELGKTGQKTIDIAINVNNVLDKLTDDVRFYNDYKAITYDDLNSNIELLDDLIIKVENLAEQLFLEPKEIDGYVMAVNAVIDAKRIAGDMLRHNLLFDI
jgi:hypothetical protein